MKIAFVSDNEITISRHFGRARQYVVVTIEEGREVAREVRVKMDCHSNHAETSAHGNEHGDPHHDLIFAAITDCQIVVAGGMGAAMDERLQAVGIQAIRTRIPAIDTAVEKFLNGRLNDTIELVH